MSWHTNKEFYISWEEFHRATRELSKQLLPATQWRGIIAVSRGGLVPAAIVARELNIRLVESICCSSYDHDDQRDMQVLNHPAIPDDGEGFLVVDDLVDTGGTLKLLRKMYPNAHFVTVYAKPQGEPLVDRFVANMEQETWVHFPWDVQLNYSTPLVDIIRMFLRNTV